MTTFQEARFKNAFDREVRKVQAAALPNGRIPNASRKSLDAIRGITKGQQGWRTGGYRGGAFWVSKRTHEEITKAAMNEASGLQGGYVAPLDYSLALLDACSEAAFIEPRAHVIPMISAETTCPTPDLDSQGALGTSPFFGGMNFVWGSGSSTSPVLAESEPKFKQTSLKSWDLIGQLVVANQFIEDIGEEGELALMRLFGKAMNWYKEYAFLRGTGSGNAMPLGILNAPGSYKQSRTGGNTVVLADIANMAARLIPYSWNNAVWACSPSVIAQLGTLTGFIPNSSPHDMQDGCAGNLFARPLFVSEKLPALGTLGDLIYFDPSLYVIGNREDVLIEASPHPLFQNQQTVFRVWFRGDGKPVLPNTVAAMGGQSSAYVTSAYVLLQ
jgi:HK97 family phage major capsid protein